MHVFYASLETRLLKKLLFVTYGGGHARMVCPVVHALNSSDAVTRKQLKIEVLALPAARHTLQTHGIESLGFGDFLDVDNDGDAIRWGRLLAEQHHSSTIGVDHAESVAYLGLNYKDLVFQYGETGASELFAKKGRQAFFPVSIMGRIFDQLKPDFVVTTNSPRSEAAAIAVANSRGIDNLIMTDLFTGLGGYLLKGKSITFLNAFAKNMFLADGLVDESSSQFYCTGNPAFDHISRSRHSKSVAWMNEHFPHLGGRRVVLHADMPGYWDCIKHCSHFKTEKETVDELEACYSAVRSNEAFYLVRPHPSQDRAFYQKWVSQKEGASLAADCNLHELLANIDLLIARTTTVGLEAALMKRRVLQLDWEFHKDLPLAATGVAWGASGYAHLEKEIQSAFFDHEKFARIKAQIDASLPCEPAAFKIADIILSKLHFL